MTPAEAQRKHVQLASPVQQKGVRCHDKKRRHILSPITMLDMEVSEEELHSPLALNVLLPPNMENLSISSYASHDVLPDGDTTLVSPVLSPSTMPLAEGKSTPSTMGMVNQRPCNDLPWIVKRFRVTLADPPFTQMTPQY